MMQLMEEISVVQLLMDGRRINPFLFLGCNFNALCREWPSPHMPCNCRFLSALKPYYIFWERINSPASDSTEGLLFPLFTLISHDIWLIYSEGEKKKDISTWTGALILYGQVDNWSHCMPLA